MRLLKMGVSQQQRNVDKLITFDTFNVADGTHINKPLEKGDYNWELPITVSTPINGNKMASRAGGNNACPMSPPIDIDKKRFIFDVYYTVTNGHTGILTSYINQSNYCYAIFIGSAARIGIMYNGVPTIKASGGLGVTRNELFKDVEVIVDDHTVTMKYANEISYSHPNDIELEPGLTERDFFLSGVHKNGFISYRTDTQFIGNFRLYTL